MAATEVLFYREDDQRIPVLDWLLTLKKRDNRAFRKCFATIRLLKDHGRDLRRPYADSLRDGVFELRARVGTVNYRVLYGFVGQDVALLTVGLKKEKKVPPADIDKALARIETYRKNPEVHGYHYEDQEHG